MIKLVDEKLGEDVDVKLSIEAGKIIVAVSFAPEHLLDKLKAVIPGVMDDALIEAAKAALAKA